MAKSKVQIIDSLIQEVSKFKMTDDHALFNAREWLGDKLDGYRATVIKKIAQEKQLLESCYQLIECLTPECVVNECVIEGLTISADSGLWKVKIPELLDIDRAIKYFGLASLQVPYQKIDFSGLVSKDDRWGRKVRKYARIGNELYYHKFDGTRTLSLIAITASPSNVCGFMDTKTYPLPKESEMTLELLVKKDLYQMLGLPADDLNDANDNPGGQIRQPKNNDRGEQQQ